MNSNRIYFVVVLALALLLSLTACTPARTLTPVSPTATLAPTALPTATNTPKPNDKAMLIGSPTADGPLYAAMEAAVKDLAAGSHLAVDTRPAVQPGEIGTETKVVVLLAAPANLSELLSSAPKTQFVVASSQDLPKAANLSVIRSHPEFVAFTAGFVATEAAADWRAAAMLPSDTPLAGNLSDAFVNGGHYFCGVCGSFYAPVKHFPLVVSQPGNANPVDWQAAAVELKKNIVYMIYVAPEIATPELLKSLADQNFFLLGSQTPPAELMSHWVVTIQADSVGPLRGMWPDLMAGKGAQTVEAGVTFSDIQPGIFSTGKLTLVQRMLTDLTAGMIQPFSPPQ